MLVFAKKNKLELTRDRAEIIFAKLHNASWELSDDELDNVAGGCFDLTCPYCEGYGYPYDGVKYTCSKCGKIMIDLHLHLDGSFNPKNVPEVAKMSGAELLYSEAELKKALMVDPDCITLGKYLKKFDLPLKLLQTAEC